jgi:hypothetical protein
MRSELRTEEVLSSRPSGPLPGNVRVYRARRTVPWIAIYGFGALLFLLAIVFGVALFV